LALDLENLLVQQLVSQMVLPLGIQLDLTLVTRLETQMVLQLGKL